MYTQMERIISFVPDFSPRYITVVAVDVDGGQSPTAVVSITFSTACSQWPDTMTVVPVNASLEQIGQCSALIHPLMS